jgi:thioredoxin-related protein
LVRLENLETIGTPFLRNKAEGLPVGKMVPNAQLRTANGEQTYLHDLINGRSYCVVFADPACPDCSKILSQLPGFVLRYKDSLGFIIINLGESSGNTTPQHHGGQMLHGSKELANVFGIRGTPSMVIVDSQRKIASNVAEGLDQIEWLLPRMTIPEPS